jgi:pimeloyl-ACP methyl ester carboxylesterase
MIREATFLTTDETSIFYRLVGHGPALVLCDGIGCDQYVWKYLVEHFRDDHTVVRWNYRGHGASGPPGDPGAITVTHHALDLAQLLTRLEIEDAVLVGHSMGVQVILEFYRHFPERVRALIPMCGSFGRPLDTFHGNTMFRDGVFPTMYRLFTANNASVLDWWRRLVPTEWAFQLACLAEVNPRLIKREDFWPYLEHLSRMDMDLFVRMLRAAAEHTAEEVLEHIQVPTLIFAGARDRFTPPWLSETMHRRIDGSELCTIPGGSHSAPLELPDLVNLRTEKFLAARGLTRLGA